MDIYWRLRPKYDNFNYMDLIVKIANGKDINLSDYDIGEINNIVHTFKDEIADYILEHGLTSLLNIEPLFEQVIMKGETPNNIVIAIQKYLDKVGIDDELIIVDPYFFSSTSDTTYPSLIDQTINRYMTQLNTIRIITFPNKVDTTIKTNIEILLKSRKTTLNIVHKTSSDYHDRFWISNKREKGIMTGTSLNGYGKKYSLLDRLNTSDVREIINSLNSQRLL